MKIGDTIHYRGATIELRYEGVKGFGFQWIVGDGDEEGKHGIGTTLDDCKCQINMYWDDLDSSLPC